MSARCPSCLLPPSRWGVVLRLFSVCSEVVFLDALRLFSSRSGLVAFAFLPSWNCFPRVLGLFSWWLGVSFLAS